MDRESWTQKSKFGLQLFLVNEIFENDFIKKTGFSSKRNSHPH